MTNPIRFDGGTAVITGAASGIGSGLARHAAGLGMRVVLADLDPAKLDAFAATLDTDVLCVPTDVSRRKPSTRWRKPRGSASAASTCCSTTRA
ncbi:SDR family NAD(P)-dependent oxidoreductase [Burkholderia cepacia]|uniref:SDR family NAD(P)-dependent oxidoreductase n=1 Tax=Burkholderia cepacia TaxID=292 RepID=UPI003D66706E